MECISHLYHKFGIETCVKNLDGVFAFCIVDILKHKVFLGRDPYGVRPLFRFHSKTGVLGICSEGKGMFNQLLFAFIFVCFKCLEDISNRPAIMTETNFCNHLCLHV